jgi:hypothetical protein
VADNQHRYGQGKNGTVQECMLILTRQERFSSSLVQYNNGIKSDFREGQQLNHTMCNKDIQGSGLRFQEPWVSFVIEPA